MRTMCGFDVKRHRANSERERINETTSPKNGFASATIVCYSVFLSLSLNLHDDDDYYLFIFLIEQKRCLRVFCKQRNEVNEKRKNKVLLSSNQYEMKIIKKNAE